MTSFEEFQKKWNEENVEVKRFEWLTTNAIVSKLEIDLLSCLKMEKGFNVLEVGCGEGQNIANLQKIHKDVSFHGVDMSSNRIEFARKTLKNADLRAQDGRRLDYDDNEFDLVFCRDVLHHMIEGRETFIMEMLRTCKKGGSVVLIESNGNNIINFLFSIVEKKESEMRKITFRYIKDLLDKLRLNYRVSFVKGYGIQRLIFHYKYGIRHLASMKIGKFIFDVINFIPIPRGIYSYMIIEIQK